VKILEEESFSNIVNTTLKQNKSRSEKEDCWTDSSSPPATSTWDTNPKSYRRSNIRTRDIERLNTKDTYRSQSKGENGEHGSSCWSECRRKKTLNRPITSAIWLQERSSEKANSWGLEVAWVISSAAARPRASLARSTNWCTRSACFCSTSICHPYSPGSGRTNPQKTIFHSWTNKTRIAESFNHKATYPKTEPRSSTSDPTSPIASANGRRQGVDFLLVLFTGLRSRRGPSPIRVSPIHLIKKKKQNLPDFYTWLNSQK